MSTGNAVINRRISGCRSTLPIFLVLFLSCQAAAAIDLLAPFKGLKNLFSDDDEIVIWEDSGQFIKVVEQDFDRDHRAAKNNNHPAQIDPQQLAITLASLQGWLPESSPDTSGSVRLFTDEEISNLAPRIADSLGNIGPGQEIVFATTGYRAGTPGNPSRMTAGRLFMLDNRLNIIFGDILRPVEPGDLDNTSYYEQPHRAGKRMEALGRDIVVNNGVGISHHVPVERPRLDWVVIDISAVVAAYRGPQPVAPVAALPARVDNMQNLTSEEKRRMREELARMRAQSGQVAPAAVTAPAASQTTSGAMTLQSAPAVPAAATSGTDTGSIQERLRILKDLYDQDLITEQDYDRKRSEILEQL